MKTTLTQIVIPDVDDRIVQGLKQIAWQKGLPLEESLRQLLASAVLDRSVYWDRDAHANRNSRKSDIPPFELCTD